MNKKYALFGAAAALAIAGVVYMGTGSNLQASLGAISDKVAQPKVVKPLYDNGVYTGDDKNTSPSIVTIPNVVYPGLEKEAKAYLSSVAALEKKLQTISPSSGSDRKIYYLGHGLCVSVGPLGGNPRYFSC